MKAVRVNITNMKPGDVFRAHSNKFGQVIVERPIHNMGKKAKRAYRKRLQRGPAVSYDGPPVTEINVPSVDFLMAEPYDPR